MSEAPLWSPSAERVARTNIVRFANAVAGWGGPVTVGSDGSLNIEALHKWSVDQPAAFWVALSRFAGLRELGEVGERDVVHGVARMAPPDATLGPRWFAGVRLNFAEVLLRAGEDEQLAVISWTEEGPSQRLTRADLRREVARCAAAFHAVGVREGDRVAGFVSNGPEAVIAMLAAASLGAIWSSCSPDFGVTGVLDRFGQIDPVVLVATASYRYAGKIQDCREKVREIARRLPTLRRVVLVRGATEPPDNISDTSGDSAQVVGWREMLDAYRGEEEFVQLNDHRFPFDHPLYIMYSSGTTGLPKCMVHGAGGTLIQHIKEHVLHTNIGAEDRVFYFTTCGWMMWNWLVSALATGATLVLYDGSPMAAPTDGRGSKDILWEMAERERITVFGTSAKYLALAEKEGMRPAEQRDLTAMQTILSTGSPLAEPSFDFVYRDIKKDVQLSSISGGTDIISCFALGNPAGAVWRGEIQTLGLGMRVDVFTDEGLPAGDEAGELVCTMPFPSMPVSFWNDPEGVRYRQAYFDVFPGVWRHGDWAQRTPHGGLIISGRSDATLNPGGVRIGTAEIYRQVEEIPDVLESLVVGQDIRSAGEGERDTRIVLFVRLRPGVELDDTLKDTIRRRVRAHCTPHHVPKVIVQVADIPRTRSGKITELAVRDVIHGRQVKNVEALANPESLELYRNLPDLLAGG